MNKEPFILTRQSKTGFRPIVCHTCATPPSHVLQPYLTTIYISQDRHAIPRIRSPATQRCRI